MKRIATGILFVSLAFGATACGDDGGDSDGESSSDTIVKPAEGVEGEVATAAEGYFNAFAAGDAATVRTFLSARCDGILTEPDFSTFITGVAQAAPDLAITAWREVEVDGDEATVEYDTGVEAVDAAGAQRWINENGGWKYDSCNEDAAE